MTGHLFGDRYQVGDTLGFGGMSEVHRGRDLRLGRDVAIKVLRADLARDPSFQARFRREAQNAASLNHPAIVAVYDTGETQGETGPVPYIVMEYVDGETLRDLLRREGPLRPEAGDGDRRRRLRRAGLLPPARHRAPRHQAGQRHAHPGRRGQGDGLRHRPGGRRRPGHHDRDRRGHRHRPVPLARSRPAARRSTPAPTSTPPGACCTSCSPAQPPFTGDSPVAVAYQHVREEPKPPSTVKPGLPHELDAIVLKALNKNPLNRYQTAAEMRADLVGRCPARWSRRRG